MPRTALTNCPARGLLEFAKPISLVVLVPRFQAEPQAIVIYVMLSETDTKTGYSSEPWRTYVVDTLMGHRRRTVGRSPPTVITIWTRQDHWVARS